MADVLKIKAEIDSLSKPENDDLYVARQKRTADREAKTKALETAREERLKERNPALLELQKQRDEKLVKLGLKAPKLDTVSGLYTVASRNGLQDKANKVIRDNSGEEYKKIFSGGWISDIFDVLNMASYGVVGTLKGKGFAEGVKNKESFADQDSLGQYGLVGSIAGTALDIAFDPFTYIAPWKVATKIPGVTKAVKAATEGIFGKQVLKAVDETQDVLNRTAKGGDKVVPKNLTRLMEVREGGTTIGRKIADSVVWMFGADDAFKNTYNKMMRETGLGATNAVNLIKPLSKLGGKMDDSLSKIIFSNDVDERLIRKTLPELQDMVLKKEIDENTFNVIKPIWDEIDNLGKQLVDEGVLSADKYEDNLGKYLHQYYKKYVEEKKKSIFAAKPTGIAGNKARSETLTKEGIEALGRIEDPSYVLGRTMLEMSKDIANAKLLNSVNKGWAVDTFRPGFKQVANTPKFQTKGGTLSTIYTQIGDVNTKIKPLLKELETTFKGDKNVLADIQRVRKQLTDVSGKEIDELKKFFFEGDVVKKTVSKSGRLGTLTEKLQPLANVVKKFDSFDALMKTPDGIQLEKAFVNGDLNQFKSMEDFFDVVKNPFKAGSKEVKDAVLEKGSPRKLVSLQKDIEKLTEKATTLTDIEKKSIDDSFRVLEKQINDLRFKKEGLQELASVERYGQLAGKWIPDHMAKYIDEVIKPSETNFGNRLISEFKFQKVVLSPATHVRNILSNMMLNHWKLGIIPGDKAYFEALKEIKDGSGKYIDMARKYGYGADTMMSQEIYNILDNDTMWKGAGKKIREAQRKIGDIYQEEENWAKLSAFIKQVKRGIEPEEAWKMAESATFNYAQVTPFVRKLRQSVWGVPFITFPLKATPLAIETLGTKPGRISAWGKFRNSIEEQSDTEETKKERASEPQWIKNGFYVKSPIKDAEGRSAYFDLTYIIPMGDLVSGTFFERGVNRETGLKESPASAVLSKSPVLNFIKELSKNQDFTGNQIVKSSDSLDKQIGDLTRHVFKTFAPPPIAEQIPGGYDKEGNRVKSGLYATLTKEEEANQKRTVGQELAKYLGIKLQPVDSEIQEKINDWNAQKGLETILREGGVTNDFRTSYIKK